MAVVTVLVLFTGGEVDKVVVDGTTFDLPQLTQTVVAGPDLPTIPTPNPDSRDLFYIHVDVETGHDVRTILAVKPAGSVWSKKETGEEILANGTQFLVCTLDLGDQAVSVAAYDWKVVLTDTIPTGIEYVGP